MKFTLNFFKIQFMRLDANYHTYFNIHIIHSIIINSCFKINLDTFKLIFYDNTINHSITKEQAWCFKVYQIDHFYLFERFVTCPRFKNQQCETGTRKSSTYQWSFYYRIKICVFLCVYVCGCGSVQVYMCICLQKIYLFLGISLKILFDFCPQVLNYLNQS